MLSSGEDGDDYQSSSSSSKAADDPFLDDLIPKRGKHDFKIFVYDLKPEFNADLARDQPRCRTDQYGTEIRFHENLLHHSVLTNDPEEAEFFFVPIYGECYLFRETQNSGTNNAMKVTNLWYRDALKTIQTEYPYWNRTDGRDHVWSFPGARGPHIFRDWKKLIKKSVFLTPEGDRSFGEQFNVERHRHSRIRTRFRIYRRQVEETIVVKERYICVLPRDNFKQSRYIGVLARYSTKDGSGV